MAINFQENVRKTDFKLNNRKLPSSVNTVIIFVIIKFRWALKLAPITKGETYIIDYTADKIICPQ